MNERAATSTATALYALNSLTDEERREFEERLHSGAIDLYQLHEDLETVAALGERIASAMPAPRRALKDRILQAVLDEEATPSSVPLRSVDDEITVEGHTVVRAETDRWEEIGLPGITVKMLHRDEVTPRYMFLARLEPGAIYPAHRHVGVEECYVIQGELQIGDTLLNEGDFILALPDSLHGVATSRTGCMVLICSPFNDEFLPIPTALTSDRMSE